MPVAAAALALLVGCTGGTRESRPPSTEGARGSVERSTATTSPATSPTASTPTTVVTTTPYVVPVADVAGAGWSETHAGYPATDVFLGCGSNLVSPVSGELLEVRRVDAWDAAVDDPATRGGRSVAILGDDGVRYYLAHLDTVVEALAPGGRVTAGEVLGTMGRTGRASACHLHFAISPPCPGPEWAVRRGVVWPYRYLDAWRRGEQLSPAGEVRQWSAANPDACAIAMADADAVACVELSDEVLAGQVLLALVDRPSAAAALLSTGAVAGLAPYGRVSESDARELREVLDGDHPYGVLVAADEEGGRVQRFGDLLGPLPSAAELARTTTAAEAAHLFEAYGNLLRDAGVDMAFAPVVDVGGGPAIGDRSFGDDPAIVTSFGQAVVDGYQAAGVMPVLKHFPGHGRASGDTHDGAAIVPPIEELRRVDLVPYLSVLADDGPLGVMVGHLDVPGLTDGLPASMSPAAIDGLLRTELGFDGLVVSDALGMGAIADRFPPGEAAVRFLAAGGDLAVVPVADVPATRATVLEALESGGLDRTRLRGSVDRVLRVKHVDPCTLEDLR